MRKFRYCALLFSVFFFAAVSGASAQTSLGVRGGYDLEIEEPFIGVEARLGGANFGLPITIVPSAEYYFVGSQDVDDAGIDYDQTFLVFDLNALYSFGVDNTYFTPYVGAGLGVAYNSVEFAGNSESDTDFGVNLVGGAIFGGGNLRPFAQARIRLTGDYELLTLMGGVLFRLGQ